MKKLMTGLLTAGLVLGAGTAVLAAENQEPLPGQGIVNFGQMLSFMRQVHPNLTEQQLQDLYKTCHGTGGAAPSKNFQPMNPQFAPQGIMITQ